MVSQRAVRDNEWGKTCGVHSESSIKVSCDCASLRGVGTQNVFAPCYLAVLWQFKDAACVTPTFSIISSWPISLFFIESQVMSLHPIELSLLNMLLFLPILNALALVLSSLHPPLHFPRQKPTFVTWYPMCSPLSAQGSSLPRASVYSSLRRQGQRDTAVQMNSV